MQNKRWRAYVPPNFLRLAVVVLLVVLSGCVTSPPRQVDNVCSIFEEKRGWYKQANASQKKWGVSIPIMMAFMHQESRFQPKARPPRTRILWVIPGPRRSNAYGFAQAKTETWAWYKRETGAWGADRDDFADAVDFIGWYNHTSHKRNRIALNDSYNLYLAYHEGHGGYNRRTYQNKAWLKNVASRVTTRTGVYQQQLASCEKRLNRGGWWFF